MPTCRTPTRPPSRGCKRAGAIVIGKTNLDQFATGLVGTRTPYGIAAQSAEAGPHPRRIEHRVRRSRSRRVSFRSSLGTDTAGSGRVPAMLNNIVGLKPSLGLVSTAGVVPACRTLDCVSVFALTIDDAWAALAAIAGPDRTIPIRVTISTRRAWRSAAGADARRAAERRTAVLRRRARQAADYEAALARLAGLGATIVDIDIEPFYETARLLYEGPWVAER